MKNSKNLIVTVIYGIIIFLLGVQGGYQMHVEKLNEQKVINSQLKNEYDGLKINYDSINQELKWQLESCYQQLGDIQDKYELSYEVNK